MNKQYRLIVFDWEGTISDTLGQVITCVAKEAQRLNFGDLDIALARQSVELGLVRAMKKVFPHLTANEHEQLLMAVQQSLNARHAEVYLIPGVADLIKLLVDHHLLLAIATNKGQQSLQRALSQTALGEFFPVVRSASTFPAKPSPAMLEDILAFYNVSAQETLMVGDSITDIEMAKQIHVDAIGFDFYDQHRDLLLNAGALAVFNDYHQVADFLQLS
jgi:phosphoglycolate phosphatase